MRAARTDAVQAPIVAALREIGASVHLTHQVGGGFPDFVVGYRGENYLMECKSEGESPNALQRAWYRQWSGRPVAIVRTIEDALWHIGAVG